MDGKELFNTYLAKRDFSGSKDDEYAQLMFTLDMNMDKGVLFELLEKAELLGKRLEVVQDPKILWDSIDKNDIIFV